MRRYTLDLRGRAFVVDVQELAADRYEVRVDGASYEVTLSGDEDLPRASVAPGVPGASSPAETPTTTTVRQVHARGTPAAPRARSAANTGSATVSAPMPGVILEVHVKAGDRVERGQPLAVLEAMKMHNLIGAPRAGVIAEVCVAPGQAIGHGDALVRYAET
jgi:glutaconyl-CoA/methylmalonyl-CoA decarboxylase subunit gamma